MENINQHITNIESSELIYKTSTIYELFLQKELEINLPNDSIKLNQNDKLIVSFLLAIIITNKKRKMLLKLSNITFENITNSIEYFYDLKENIQKYEKSNARDTLKEYEIADYFFSNYKNKNNLDDVSFKIDVVLYNLMQPKECNSKMLDHLFCKLSKNPNLTHATESKTFKKLTKKVSSKSNYLILKRCFCNKTISLMDLYYQTLYSKNETIPVPLAVKNSVQYVETSQNEEPKSLNVKEPYLTDQVIKKDVQEIERITKIIAEKNITINEKSYLEENGFILNNNTYITNPAVGRELEIKNLMVTLLTDEKSPVIIGDAGVGKTSIVEGLVYLIKRGEVPRSISDKKIIKLNLSTIINGCRYVGTLETKMEKIIVELSSRPDVILFIDEIHNIIGAGATSKDPMDISNILKPHLDRGNIKIIGATTKIEYEAHFGADEAFKRRFEPIHVTEPTDEMLFVVLDLAIKKLEVNKQVKFLFKENVRKQIVITLIELTKKKNRNHTDYINNPDLAISILSKSFAFALLTDSKNVTVDNIIDSINSSNRIVESVKSKYTNIIKDCEDNSKENENPNDNIIHIKLK